MTESNATESNAPLYRHLTENPIETSEWQLATDASAAERLYAHLGDSEVDASEWQEVSAQGNAEGPTEPSADTQRTDGQPSDAAQERTTYALVGEGDVDESVWPPAHLLSNEGQPLYYYSGDTEPGDAKGASDHWVVTTPAQTPDPTKRASDGTPPAEPMADAATGQPQQGLAAAEANPGVGSSPVGESRAAVHDEQRAGSADPQAKVIDPVDGEQPVGALTTDEHVARAANNGSTDFQTSNEDDQPETFIPPLPGPGAPDAPTITSPEGGATVASERVVITGTAGNGNLVYLEEGEGQFPVNPATASDGAFRFVIALEPGEHALSARQRNAAGDISDPSEQITITVESAPNVEEITDPDEKFAEFLRQHIVNASRLGWDLFAELHNQAVAWLEHRG